MKAMVYHGANDIRFEEKPRPQIIDPTDAVVKIVKTTICGTDLGIWKGKNPEVADGRILGRHRYCRRSRRGCKKHQSRR